MPISEREYMQARREETPAETGATRDRFDTWLKWIIFIYVASYTFGIWH